MKKIVIKYGNSYVISFTRFERQIYNIKKGSIIDLTDIIVLNPKTLPQPSKQARTPLKKRDDR